MACSIKPVLMDIDCPKEGAFTTSQTLWGKVERVEHGFRKGTIYIGAQIIFHINETVPKWVIPGIMVEINIGSDGKTTIQQINE